MKRIRCLCCLLLAVLLLNGCSAAGFDADNFLQPPRPVGMMAEIQTVLEEYAGTGFTLKYPRSGEYRSAIILEDLDSDGAEEAIAFYRPATESGGTHFVVMDTVDGAWKVVREVTGPGVDVERVVFTHFDASDQLSILIGWNMYSRDKIGTVYYYAGQTLTASLTEFSYTEMVVNDFDGDGSNELFSLLLNTTDLTAAGKLLERNPKSGLMEKVSEIELDGNISAYAQVLTGSVSSALMPGVVIDAYKSSTALHTEVVYWNEVLHKLQAVGTLYVNNEVTPQNPLLRESTICSRDLNGDGIIELPSQRFCMNLDPVADGIHPDGADATLAYTPVRQAEYYVVWLQLSSYYQAQPVAYSVHTDSYYFQLNPQTAEKWMATLYFKQSENGAKLTFYDSVTDQAVLTLASFTESVWLQQGKNSGFIELLRNNGQVYAFQTTGDTVTADDLNYLKKYFTFN